MSKEEDISHIDKKYDILKILQKGYSTYIGMDCVEGELLIDIIRSGDVYEPLQFYKWCYSLCDDIHSYHKSRKKAFKYITPYTVVIGDDNKAYLMDLQSSSNQEIKHYVESNRVKDYFALPHDIQRRNKYLADYYSLAKTIQFILSQVQFEPNFSKQQIKQLKKVTNTCIGLKKIKYQNIKDLQREFIYHESPKYQFKKMVFLISLLLVASLYFV